MPGRHEARKEEMLHGLAEIVRDRGVRFRGWKVTIERLMLVEARDEQEHAAQLREWGGRELGRQCKGLDGQERATYGIGAREGHPPWGVDA